MTDKIVMAMDVGNTNIKIGLFYTDGSLHQVARLATDLIKTSDEYGLQIIGIFQYAGLQLQQVEGIIMSSVVPSINYTLEHMCQTFFHMTPLILGHGVKTGLVLKYDNPKELGSDRIASAVAALAKYGGPIITIDFGTATTFNCVNAQGEFLGGAIMPGIRTSLSALVTQTSRLPNIELQVPSRVIGRNTVENMQAGLLYGYVGAVERIIAKMREELGDTPKVVATGGMSRMIAKESSAIDILDSRLTLEGLFRIYRRNAAKGESA